MLGQNTEFLLAYFAKHNNQQAKLHLKFRLYMGYFEMT